MINYNGMSDLPIKSKKDDKLGILKYVDGFVEFLENTDAPMSIAIKGP